MPKTKETPPKDDLPKDINVIRNQWTFGIDPAYSKVKEFDSQMVKDVWSDKYRWQNESYDDMCLRVAEAVYAQDPDIQEAGKAYGAMLERLWMPAGRILAGAGTGKRVTLMNCFVNGEVKDSMESIADGVRNIMLTMQQGGGVGTDFSNLRPPMAMLRRTGSTASGPGPFIDQWDSTCVTIRSAGDRRGAMMGTMLITHPWIVEFATAKQTSGKWTNFNVSVLVTDAFMGAVEDDEEWYLHHPAQPSYDRPRELVEKDFTDDETGEFQYVYAVHRARDLWDQILRSTYEYAEPGVIFIDRVNDLNNLQYCEHIQCTNPCGEQPLPYHGCCNLGAVNLTRMVRNPFTENAEFRWDLLTQVTAIGTRFLDNVIDVTGYPLEEQAIEERSKRRIGVGISGLADAMAQLGMRYGSPQSCEFAEKVMKLVAETAYDTSADLAEDRGPFSEWKVEEFNSRPFIQKLPPMIRDKIYKKGIRNGVLLTIAPTGTTSIAYGNNSSGLEPVFLHSTLRKVRQGDNTMKEYVEYGYNARLWLALNPDKTIDDLPKHMNVAEDVRVHEHIRIQEVCQRWVDASISKTINLPTEISYEDFRDVYTLAYESGLKGCTTYRPSDVRGSILSAPGASTDSTQSDVLGSSVFSFSERPEEVGSRTIKVRWPGLKSALYLTVGYVDGRPYEVFLNSKDQSSMEWMTSTTLLMSMALRNNVSMETLAQEFKQIHALEGGWAEGQYYPSLISYLGKKLESLVTDEHSPLGAEKHSSGDQISSLTILDRALSVEEAKNWPKMEQCPSCREYAVTMQGGCRTCTSCGHSKCA